MIDIKRLQSNSEEVLHNTSTEEIFLDDTSENAKISENETSVSNIENNENISVSSDIEVTKSKDIIEETSELPNNQIISDSNKTDLELTPENESQEFAEKSSLPSDENINDNIETEIIEKPVIKAVNAKIRPMNTGDVPEWLKTE